MILDAGHKLGTIWTSFVVFPILIHTIKFGATRIPGLRAVVLG